MSKAACRWPGPEARLALEPAALETGGDLFHLLPVAAFCADSQGRLLKANSAFEELFRLSASAIGERGLQAVAPADGPLTRLIGKAFEQGGGFTDYDVELTLPHGGRLIADLRVEPLADQPAVMAVVHPRPIERVLARRVAHDGAARSAVGIAAMLAHEIKNPLSGIRGAAQLLEQGADSGERELTELICGEVDRIRALIDRMEIFTDSRPAERAPENIHRILSHVRHLAEIGFARGLTIRERYDPSLPDLVCSREQLIQVFLNLLKNAAEAVRGAGGDILVTTAYRHGLRMPAPDGSGHRVATPIEVCVIDSGPGAPEAIAPHLFEPFVTTRPRGTGLGLALVAKLIGEHGGSVDYERLQAPARTVMRVLLPLGRDAT